VLKEIFVKGGVYIDQQNAKNKEDKTAEDGE
jgi:hypothetical protein